MLSQLMHSQLMFSPLMLNQLMLNPLMLSQLMLSRLMQSLPMPPPLLPVMLHQPTLPLTVAMSLPLLTVVMTLPPLTVVMTPPPLTVGTTLVVPTFLVEETLPVTLFVLPRGRTLLLLRSAMAWSQRHCSQLPLVPSLVPSCFKLKQT